ncbi:hypothetical protein KUCAC02_028044 [Chaenocephalus aceratus]|uniref:Uncharacterized protein n=1 Tax=Chaenocephalus aceratus TaxID=36190 RepID=A0ACB9X290_CHAAC|nr:hypothetical protein KUCAC02_028044 [Chaenocephalus aceratus]
MHIECRLLRRAARPATPLSVPGSGGAQTCHHEVSRWGVRDEEDGDVAGDAVAIRKKPKDKMAALAAYFV